MVYEKTGMPSEGELVLCKISTVQYNSVFAHLLEYEPMQGMIHISEISPGRIRNIRDFVKEGKVIVCKILRINIERRHIDLSLRRVSDYQRRQKVNEIKQEQLAEKIIEHVAKKLKQDPKEIYSKVIAKIGEDYERVYPFFEGVVEGESSVDELGLDKAIAKDLLEVIKQRIKPQEVTISGTFALESYAHNGVDVVKEALTLITKKGGPALSLVYAGAGNFNFQIISSDYKQAEKILADITTVAEEAMQKHHSTVVMTRKDK